VAEFSLAARPSDGGYRVAVGPTYLRRTWLRGCGGGKTFVLALVRPQDDLLQPTPEVVVGMWELLIKVDSPTMLRFSDKVALDSPINRQVRHIFRDATRDGTWTREEGRRVLRDAVKFAYAPYIAKLSEESCSGIEWQDALNTVSYTVAYSDLPRSSSAGREPAEG